MALHTWDHRITMTDFRLCSSCRSRSQAGFCHCTHQLISDQLEPTIARLRYSLGGDHQSNYPPCRVPPPDDEGRLEVRDHEGGISRLAPRELAPPLQCLPPILHTRSLTPLQSC